MFSLVHGSDFKVPSLGSCVSLNGKVLEKFLTVAKYSKIRLSLYTVKPVLCDLSRED
jgi:hypothetical protein